MNPTTGTNVSNSAALGIMKDTKPFAELTLEEKVERLATELRNGRYLVSRVAELEQKLRRLERHSHSEGGKVVVEINDINNSLNSLGMCGVQTRDPLMQKKVGLYSVVRLRL
jgi:ketol-acid reductoisomerase